ncbi:MAG TPA: NAD(P)H-binding protein, partial [Candidatus Angelobacter sp.]|nr:NAD(P)H-binding protein [Candidatus Angelobacter sp.]
MKVFLTGATGFVGRNMLKRLLENGHSVRALVREREGLHELPGVAYIPGDIVSGAGLDQGMQGCN